MCNQAKKTENFLYKAQDFLHEFFTVKKLEKECSTCQAKTPYKPLRRFLYVAASCLPYHISGYAVRTHEIAKALQKFGAEAFFLTRSGYPWDRKDALKRIRESATCHEGVTYEHERRPTQFSFLPSYAIRGARVIAAKAIEKKAACIHAASNHFNAMPALLAARSLDLPFQYEMRGLWEFSKATRVKGFENSPGFKWGLQMEGYVAKHAHRVFVISEQLGKFAREHWSIDAEKIKLLPNCVNPEMLEKTSDKEIVPALIGYAGALVGYEGLDTLIEAMAILKERNIRAHLVVMGDGDQREEFEHLTKKLNLGSMITFQGRCQVEEAREKLLECALVCIPRKPRRVCEMITPLKLIEAMALGKPIIAPDLPVFRDELGDLGNGWLFRPDDPYDLAGKIENVLGNPHLLKSQGAKVRQKARESRVWSQYMPDMVELMEQKCLGG